MKRQSLSVSIPEPCHEDWSEMTIKEKGRHCVACNKTVVDYTKMSKAGVVDHISSNEGDICGRFSADQLGVNLLPARRNRFFSKWAAVFLGLIPVAGYGQIPVQANERIEQDIMGKRMMKTSKPLVTNPKPNDGILTGRLIDAETKESIIFGNVAAYKEGVLVSGVETDIDGNFSIDIKDADEIEFSYLGYEHTKRKIADINTSQNSPLIIELGNQDYLLGDVIILAYKTPIIKGACSISCGTSVAGEYQILEGDSWLKRQWRKFKKLVITSHDAAVENREMTRMNHVEEDLDLKDLKELKEPSVTPAVNGLVPSVENAISIFPNPTVGMVTIELPLGISKAQLQVTDSNNQLIHYAKIQNNAYRYDASALLSGRYIISIINENELIASEIFIKI